MRRCSRSRTTTARTPTCSSGPTRSAATATVRLRVPRPTRVDKVVLRSVVDGEIRPVGGGARRGDGDGHVVARGLRGRQPGRAVPLAALRRRRRLRVGERSRRRPSTTSPTRTTSACRPERPGRTGTLRSVVYEIFPDRFALDGRGRCAAAVGQADAWGERPTGRGVKNQFDFYGGDLGGIEAHLDHVERLGVGALYMTPIFPAGTSHRYDADELRPHRPAARRRRGVPRARPRSAGARPAADRRPDAQPLRLGPRVVRARPRGHCGRRTLLLLLGRLAAARLRQLVRPAAPAEAQLGLGRALRSAARRRRATGSRRAWTAGGSTWRT